MSPLENKAVQLHHMHIAKMAITNAIDSLCLSDQFASQASVPRLVLKGDAGPANDFAGQARMHAKRCHDEVSNFFAHVEALRQVFTGQAAKE